MWVRRLGSGLDIKIKFRSEAMEPYKGICEDGHIMIQAGERNFTSAHRI